MNTSGADGIKRFGGSHERPPVWSRGAWSALAFALAYTLASVPVALASGNNEFLFYIVVMAVLGAAVAWVHIRVRLTGATLWALSVWGVLHMAGGLVPLPAGWPASADTRVLYNLWLIPDRLKYDQVVHAYGFAVTTWVCWQGLRTATRDTVRPTFGVLGLCAAAGVGFGAMNEVVEFVATLLLPKTNVGGYENTGWDLVSNAVGATFAAVLIRLTWREPPPRSTLR